MRVAIVGFATEGVVSAQYWHNQGNDVTVCDTDETLTIPAHYHAQLGENYLDSLDTFDLIVRSAGINPHLIANGNDAIAKKITTNIEEFMRVCPSRNIIGVTGTKGKGTTSTLIAKMLEASGKTVHLGGNIGVAALQMLPDITTEDWVVLEISSFQLADFKGPSPHIAVCLMVVPEHLNWHDSMDDYTSAKSHLFAYQHDSDIAIFYKGNENSEKIVSVSGGQKIPYGSPPGAVVEDNYVSINGQNICHVDDIKLIGKHNWQNVCAAVTAVWQVTQDVPAIASVLGSFSGLEHRLEFVRELDGVRYYDASFATTPETSIAAIQAFTQPKVLILGGSDKGIALDPIADEVVKSTVRHVVAIGDRGPIIKELLETRGFTDITLGLTTMEAIVADARGHTQTGDVVLLSTGCASYGLFKDYKDRGDQFKQCVQALS
jgi:UDP-N-acetylmuramoylalanine--D-glutamate ligase